MERYKEKYKQEFDPFVWRNHDALIVLRKAIETAGTLDTTAVRDTMPKVRLMAFMAPRGSVANPITVSMLSTFTRLP
jgi:hypothetical protein